MTGVAGVRPEEAVYARYADRVAALAGHDVPAAALPGPRQAGPWRRTYGRLDPGGEPFATLVFERAGEIVRLEAYEAPPVLAGVEAEHHDGAGWLRVEPLAADPRLPALAGLVGGSEPGTVVRYRPYSRCTIRFDRPEGARFAKVFCDGQGPRVHLEATSVWSAYRDGRLGFAVARPEGLDEATGVVWQAAVDGRPADPALREPGGAALAESLGRAAGTLPRSSVRPYRAHGPEAQLARTVRVCARLAGLLPELGEPALAMLERLRALHSRAPRRELRPTHGDLTPDQWLHGGDGGVALLDFEELVLADPERDAGIFLADLVARGGGSEPVEALASSFLSGYESSAGALRGDLVRAYTGHKLLRKAHLAACSVSTDGPRRAAERLDRGLRWLDEGWA